MIKGMLIHLESSTASQKMTYRPRLEMVISNLYLHNYYDLGVIAYFVIIFKPKIEIRSGITKVSILSFISDSIAYVRLISTQSSPHKDLEFDPFFSASVPPTKKNPSISPILHAIITLVSETVGVF